jgi:cytosine/creatinine deaminase
MSVAFDLLLKQGRVLDGRVVDVGLRGGRIASIEPSLDGPASATIDLGLRLTLLGLVDAHTHLDKALSSRDYPNQSGTMAEAIERNDEFFANDARTSIERRAYEAALWASSFGTTTIRTHVALDPTRGLDPLVAVMRARERLRGIIDVQIVALPQRLTSSAGQRGRELLATSLELGADVVGCSTLRDSDAKGALDEAFKIALRFDKPIDAHIDESDSPSDFELPYLAERTIAEGYQGRVVASHCCSLAAVDESIARRAIDRVATAAISVVALPATNLLLQGRTRDSRGVTRVRALLEGGVNVCCGSDNLADMFNPFGRPDLLMMASLLGLVAHLSSVSERDLLLEMITTRSATAIGIDYTLGAGGVADLVVFNTTHFDQLLARLPQPFLVVKAGKVVVGTPPEVHRQGPGVRPTAD